MKKLLLLLFISTMAYAQPNIGDPENLIACADNFDGYAYFDLTLNNPVLLQAQDPADFNITYHETESNAEYGLNPLSLPQAYHSLSGVVFARVTEIADTSSYAVAAFALNVLPRPMIPAIPVQYVTDNDIPSDGVAVTDLTLLDEIALGGDSADYIEVSYYVTAADALSGTNPIVNASAYATPSATLYVRLETIMTSCISIAPFTVVVNDFETGIPENLYICDENNDGYAQFDLTTNTVVLLNGLDANNYIVSYYETADDAYSNTNGIPDPGSYTNVNQFSQSIYVRVTQLDTSGYIASYFSINVNPSPNYAAQHIYLLDNNDSNNQDLTITLPYTDILATITAANAGNVFEVTLYNDSAHNSPITTDLTITTSAVIYYSIENTESGCVTTGTTTITILSGDYVTLPPTGEALQGYMIDQTLADLAVEGENILWYATDGTGAFPGGTETTLPNDTLLTDGTTYYATQTLNAIESTERLTVKAYSILLGIDEPDFISLTYYPNPVTDMLNIKNTNDISSVTVINILGQTVYTNNVNATETYINFSNLSSGIYIVSVSSGNKSKTLKIIKK